MEHLKRKKGLVRGQSETVSKLQMCKWMTEQILEGMVSKQTLLKTTKHRK